MICSTQLCYKMENFSLQSPVPRTIPFNETNNTLPRNNKNMCYQVQNTNENSLELHNGLYSISHCNMSPYETGVRSQCSSSVSGSQVKTVPPLNLPCQTLPTWDYGDCYNYYSNGCYNTCQFVNCVDIEDFM